MNQIYYKLKELRKKSGMTQLEIAELLNVDRSTVSLWRLEKENLTRIL